MSNIQITYGGVALGAREDFKGDTYDKTSFSNLDQISKNYLFPNYLNPCELYSAVLDGNSMLLPDKPEYEKMGLWSIGVSLDNGKFAYPVVVEFVADNLYSSAGIKLGFDSYNNIFANHLNIKWYRGTEIISDKDFYPDSPVYTCVNDVQYYDKVVIAFYSLNMPYNRLKLRSIEYGFGVSFEGRDIRSAKMIQELDPISSQIAINTADFTLDSHSDIVYSFQEKQPISIYFGGELQGTLFVKNAKRKSKSLWSVQSEDYIGLLADVPFAGGVYENKLASELIAEIFSTAKIPYDLEAVFANETVSGYIPYGDCRSALMQVLFAIQAAVDTSKINYVRIFRLVDTIRQKIPKTRILVGQSFGERTTVTSVELTAHTYIPSEETLTAYEANRSGEGDGIKVVFSEPLHSLSMTNGDIVEQGTTYAIINARSGAVLVGKKYEHNKVIKAKKNPLTLPTDLENVVEIQNATLVSAANVDRVLKLCYNYIVNNREVYSKIVEPKGFEGDKYGEQKYGEGIYNASSVSNVGDVVSIATEYSGDIVGRIVKQTFNLNGGVIVKDTVIRGG